MNTIKKVTILYSYSQQEEINTLARITLAMVRKRGRSKRPIPRHPNWVIVTATQRGLSATVDLQRDIKNKATDSLYHSSREILLAAKDVYLQTKRLGTPDFSYIAKSESNIRSNLLSMLSENAAAFGNTETHRVKSSDETIGPWNLLLNICGAAFRDFSMKMFPFPDPEFFGIRVKNVGQTRRKFRIMGYSASSHAHKVELGHPDLAPLDFVDAIRHHLDYLATYCYIFDVPPLDTGRYWNLYQLRAREYLEYIYTEHDFGKDGFRVGTTAILKDIKRDIKSYYHIGRRNVQTVTDSFKAKQPSFSVDFFNEQIVEAEAEGFNSPALTELKRICKGGCGKTLDLPSLKEEDIQHTPCLRDKDVQYIWKKALKKKQKVGSQIHRMIARRQDRPWRLESVIRDGDSLVSPDEYILSSEMSLDTDLGKGKADLILLKRASHPDDMTILHVPVMVVEIKTKLGQSWEFDHRLIESMSRLYAGLDQRVVIDSKLRNRTLSDREWTAIQSATPNEDTVKQVQAYLRAIQKVFNSVSKIDDSGQMLSATLLIEATEDMNSLANVIRPLIVKVFERIENRIGEIERTLFEPILIGNKTKTSVVVHEQKWEGMQFDTLKAASWVPVYNPLEGVNRNGRRFILYLDESSPTAAGDSAAWIARYYHGLELTHDLITENDIHNVVWFDLADHFVSSQLAESRLFLQPYSSREIDVHRAQPECIREMFESFTVKGLRKEIDSFLFDNGEPPTLRHHDGLTSKSRLIIVSGWDDIQEATPEPHRDRLNELHSILLKQIPRDENTIVVWFDSPVPGETSSIAYNTRTLLPFYGNSPLAGEVSEIVWNLPVAPASEVDPDKWHLSVLPNAPMYDELRIIITHHLNGLQVRFALVPPLGGWSKRFVNRGRGIVARTDSEIEAEFDHKLRLRMKGLALTLIPWISRLWPSVPIDSDQSGPTVGDVFSEIASGYDQMGRVQVPEGEILKGAPASEPTLLQSLRFRPRETKDGKSYVSTGSGPINSQRLYQGPRCLKTKRRGVNIVSESAVELRYGLRLECEELGYDWIALQEPRAPQGIILGLFPMHEQSSEGTLRWSLTRLDLVREIAKQITRFKVVEEFAVLRQPAIGNTENQGADVWTRDTKTQSWNRAGLLNHVRRSYSSPTALRAFSIESDGGSQPQSHPEFLQPTHLKESVLSAIEGFIDRLQETVYAKVELRESKGACTVRFVDAENGDLLHEIATDSNPDLVRLLRWPMTTGRPLHLKHDLSVTWNPFHDFSNVRPDIDYGEFGFLQRIVTKNLSEESPTVPSVVSTALRELRPFHIEISHDSTLCPLTDDPRVGMHGACWAIHALSEKGYLDLLFREIDGVPMSDKEVYGHVEAHVLKLDKRRLKIDFNHGPDENDRLVFNESEFMRELSVRYRSIPLQRLYPGHTAKIKFVRRGLTEK